MQSNVNTLCIRLNVNTIKLNWFSVSRTIVIDFRRGEAHLLGQCTQMQDQIILGAHIHCMKRNGLDILLLYSIEVSQLVLQVRNWMREKEKIMTII